mgnify:CR=1 FL=1
MSLNSVSKYLLIMFSLTLLGNTHAPKCSISKLKPISRAFFKLIEIYQLNNLPKI